MRRCEYTNSTHGQKTKTKKICYENKDERTRFGNVRMKNERKKGTKKNTSWRLSFLTSIYYVIVKRMHFKWISNIYVSQMSASHWFMTNSLSPFLSRFFCLSLPQSCPSPNLHAAYSISQKKTKSNLIYHYCVKFLVLAFSLMHQNHHHSYLDCLCS